MSNENLRTAKRVKNDEFYTRYEDIEKELIHYKDQFKGKIVYCNCDTPESQFVKFFNDVKDEWGIEDIWHTSLDEGISYDSPQAIELLDKCDIVVTNCPFSKARTEYFPLMFNHNKKFLFIGSLNMATYSLIFVTVDYGQVILTQKSSCNLTELIRNLAIPYGGLTSMWTSHLRSILIRSITAMKNSTQCMIITQPSM